MKVKRTERGWAGHFILGYRCHFRRNTLLELGETKVVVSTVGRLPKMDGDKKGFEEIGSYRYYETMAFMAHEVEGGYIDADVTRHVSFDADWAIGDYETDSEQRANDMHEAVCDEIENKILKGKLEAPA